MDPSCAPSCTRHPEHVYTICYPEPVMVADRSSLLGEDVQPISHYVGWTGRRPPVNRIRAHKHRSVQHLVQLRPGNQAAEAAAKRNGRCPKCGDSLWFFNAPHPGPLPPPGPQPHLAAWRGREFAASIARFTEAVGRQPTAAETEIIASPSGSWGSASGIVGFPSPAFWQQPPGTLAADVLTYGVRTDSRHVARRADLPEHLVRELVVEDRDSDRFAIALVAGRRDLPDDLALRLALTGRRSARVAMAGRHELPEVVEAILTLDPEPAIQQRLTKRAKSRGLNLGQARDILRRHQLL